MTCYADKNSLGYTIMWRRREDKSRALCILGLEFIVLAVEDRCASIEFASLSPRSETHGKFLVERMA
jgi:hypothetical protein